MVELDDFYACLREWRNLKSIYLATSPPDEDELEEVDDDSDVPELRSRESLPRSAKVHPKGKYREAPSPPPLSESDRVPYNPRSQAVVGEGEPEMKEEENADFIRYTELEEGTTEYLKPNIEDALPPKQWLDSSHSFTQNFSEREGKV